MNFSAEWIFHPELAGEDIYCDFYDSFTYPNDGTRVLAHISADSNYALWLNGTLCDSGQYADYPHYKVYDTLDLTPYLSAGVNHLAITVWYYGRATCCYIPGRAALLYEVTAGEHTLCASHAGTLCRPSREYENGRRRLITSQLGFGFHYDATGDDGWRCGGGEGFVPAARVDQELPLFPRPIKKLSWGKPITPTVLKNEGDHYLYDLGREEVGYLSLSVHSAVRQRLTIAYGEHLVDGAVPRVLGPRDFSVEVTVGEGETVYLNPFRRLGLRYLEVFAEAPLTVGHITVIPTDYPLTPRGTPPAAPTERAIYEIAVRTLMLCMHEHYEDCPWREQAMYCMDSRNEMLCGYYCFADDDFARASLRLMAEDRRADGLLSITFPCGNFRYENGLVIPSFSLHYFTEVYEYYLATGDLSLLREVYPKLVSLIDAFLTRCKDGGCLSFSAIEYWNYFEWSEGLAGNLGKVDPERHEAALDLLLILALRSMGRIAQALGEADRFTAEIPALQAGVRRRYLDPTERIFKNRVDEDAESELVNALAILAEVTTPEENARIAACLTAENTPLTPITISMLCFKYDALLKLDTARYREFVLSDIHARFQPMVDYGATTFWEHGYPASLDREHHAAASRCHGWSALPIYYYATLIGQRPPYSALI